MAFELLSEPIRRYVRYKRWDALRPIQVAAISRITSSDDNFILASRTASGKTEAAFLPILSKVDFNTPGVQVLYISPLIALINDQFYRIEELCKHLEISITKWHGEASRSAKNKVLETPNGIILITPESLEAMFANKLFNAKHLFTNLKYVVVDEIHSFIGSDRGVQLTSLLFRLQQINVQRFSIVGLSATIGDYEEAKKITGDAKRTKVILDRTPKGINANFRYFKSDANELSTDLISDLYQETMNSKALIFPNSRGRAEEVAVKLKRLSEKKRGHSNYFSHHSSVNKAVREDIEIFAKNNLRENFAIACTSTLELGIDIGTVDEVVQIDATSSIASLVQRIGRSGRRDNAASNLLLYATNEWSLIQSLACWQLYTEGFIEPPHIVSKPFDILLHQLLSIVKSKNGIPVTELTQALVQNPAFCHISPVEVNFLIDELATKDFLERIRNEVIIGIEGEKIVNTKDFYSVFTTEENYKVINSGSPIGEIPYSPQLIEGESILLAAKVWQIVYVDHEKRKIEVKVASDGKKPQFNGGSGEIHDRIRKKMLEVLFSNDSYDNLDETSKSILDSKRKEFSIFKLHNLNLDRPVLIENGKPIIFTFAGTRFNNTLGFLLNTAGIEHYYYAQSSSFELKCTYGDFKAKFDSLLLTIQNADLSLNEYLESRQDILSFSKWGQYLPLKYKIAILKERYFDLEGIKELGSFRFITNE